MMPKRKSQWRSLRPLQTAALLLMAGVAAAQGISGVRHRIGEADVARELSSIGLNVGLSQVHLPAYITSATAAPRLKIVTAESIEANQIRVELSCPMASECLPFFATLDVEAADLFSAAARLKSREAIASNRRPEVSSGAGPINESRLRVGSHAVLVIRDANIDIHLQVLAMDSGTIGQQVRVCTLDRKKVFHATVAGQGTVTGMME